MTMATTPRTCDSCGKLVNDKWRTRHLECPPPRLPDAFYIARERVRNMTYNAERRRRTEQHNAP